VQHEHTAYVQQLPVIESYDFHTIIGRITFLTSIDRIAKLSFGRNVQQPRCLVVLRSEVEHHTLQIVELVSKIKCLQNILYIDLPLLTAHIFIKPSGKMKLFTAASVLFLLPMSLAEIGTNQIMAANDLYLLPKVSPSQSAGKWGQGVCIFPTLQIILTAQ